MNQHWYHCHTCKMNDGVGCCTVCAKSCHKDHDVTYSKHGDFFCDCGAKEDGSCKVRVYFLSGIKTQSEESIFGIKLLFTHKTYIQTIDKQDVFSYLCRTILKRKIYMEKLKLRIFIKSFIREYSCIDYVMEDIIR